MDETTSELTSLLVRGEAADDPTASVAWSLSAWDTIGQAGLDQQTPFTEGFDTADLKEAKALLDKMS